MRDFFARFARDDGGATAIEYGLIIGLVFLAIVSGISLFADSANVMFQRIADTINAVL